MNWNNVANSLRDKAERMEREAVTDSRNYTRQEATLARASALNDMADAIQTELLRSGAAIAVETQIEGYR